MRPLLEVIATSPSDSRVIANAGADRIELVSALQIGGLTPSQAVLRRSLDVSDIPTMVMVRHHNLGFLLQPFERQLLIEQAIGLCDSGAKGLVVGSLTAEQKVDQIFIGRLREVISNKVEITFHKASDQTNLVETYQCLKRYGVGRVLTQGGKGPIEENSAVIRELLKVESVTTLLGGGVGFGNIQEIVRQFHPRQIHIGTCVREGKFGPVQGRLVEEFLGKLRYST